MLFLFIGLWIGLRRSLASVEATAEAIRKADPARGAIRLDLRGAPDEIAVLGSAVNKLLDRLDQALKAHHDFAANVAHELRTPLALLMLDLEQCADPVAQNARADVQSMSRLVEQLLSISRLEGLERGEFMSVDLGALARTTAARLAPGAMKTGVELEVLASGKPLARGQAEAVESALRNLVENAVRVSLAKATVTISVGPGPKISVKDEGPGIASDRLSGLFDRGRKVDRETRGSAGLGLEITKRTMELHGGRVEVESGLGRGSTFTLVFQE
jgi:signal transduction histidine kinase